MIEQRTVLIQRDHKGFGLRISSERPVIIQNVKSDNPASKAGIRPGDNILKVNGVQVINFSHQEVVQMIRSCTNQVILTLNGPSNPSINSTSFSIDFPTKNKMLSYANPSLDVDDYESTNKDLFSNDSSFNQEDQILFQSTEAFEDSKMQLSSSISNFHIVETTSSIHFPNWLSIELKKANKRQKILNELILTEKKHIENLEILNDIFYLPIVYWQLLSPEQIDYVFSNHRQLHEIHSAIYQVLEIKKNESEKITENQSKFSHKKENSQLTIDQSVGQLLIQIFEGELGDLLEKAASEFCSKQIIAGFILRYKLKKSSKLSSFLQQAEANKCCRRLQLKDMLASCFQRITKYPLLLENLMKETSDKEKEEFKLIERAYMRSKSILNKVNECVKQAINQQKLLEIRLKLN